MPNVLNIAAYQFHPLGDLERRQGELRRLCEEHLLRGTILLAPEGMNLVLAGTRPGVEEVLGAVRSIPGFEEIRAKESLSEAQPFDRMKVKIKAEIIAFGVPDVAPHEHTAPRLTPTELKAWMDEGRDFVLLDTRNRFEVAQGTFRGAISADIDDFRAFPAAVEALSSELSGRPIVTFCTGGIRCEKAAPLMEQQGHAEVYQLDGGILQYFEDVGGEHYDGDCVVFDQRTQLDAELRPSREE